MPTCSSMSFGRSSCSSIVKIARLISSFESFSLGRKGELFPAQQSGKAQEHFLTHLCNSLTPSQQQHHKQLYPACFEERCVRNVVGPCSAKAQHSTEQPWSCCKRGGQTSPANSLSPHCSCHSLFPCFTVLYVRIVSSTLNIQLSYVTLARSSAAPAGPAPPKATGPGGHIPTGSIAQPRLRHAAQHCP